MISVITKFSIIFIADIVWSLTRKNFLYVLTFFNLILFIHTFPVLLEFQIILVCGQQRDSNDVLGELGSSMFTNSFWISTYNHTHALTVKLQIPRRSIPQF